MLFFYRKVGDKVKQVDIERGKRLRELRKNELKLTQEEFSKSIGISRSNLGNIETAQISLTERNADYISLIYGINKEWLLNGTEPVFRELSKEEEIAAYLGDLISPSNTKDFQKRFIRALAKLDDDGWDVIEGLINNIAKKED